MSWRVGEVTWMGLDGMDQSGWRGKRIAGGPANAQVRSLGLVEAFLTSQPLINLSLSLIRIQKGRTSSRVSRSAVRTVLPNRMLDHGARTLKSEATGEARLRLLFFYS